MRASIINIGDELLIGQVVNTNASFIAASLSGIGIEVRDTLVVPDDKPAILNALRDVTDSVDLVIMTGGLGPTRDDVTKHAFQEFFNVDLVFNQKVYDRLAAILRKFGKKPQDSHRAQCHLPSNARLITNQLGTAPGMHFKSGMTHIYVLPGVPFEMKHLMEHAVIPELQSLNDPDNNQIYRTICTAGTSESELAEQISSIENGLREELKIAYLPKPGMVRIRLTGKISSDEVMADYETTWEGLIKTLGTKVYATEDISLQRALGQILQERDETVSVAESCTGGYLGHLFTSIPGSSAYFQGGGIVYSNELKMKLLDVPESVIIEHGAVSQATVEHMVRGAVRNFGSTYAIAVSGVAGPDGGTPEKPVGTIWICVGNSDELESRVLRLTKDRMRNIELSAIAALNLLRKFLGRRI